MQDQFTPFLIPPLDHVRFWAKVSKQDTCWLWITSCTPDGYGLFWYKSRYRLAHRFMYELTYGAIPDGMMVCHRCDVRSCVNPAHLFLGTNADNMHDKMAKGRLRVPHGEASGRAKLSAMQVKAIRAAYVPGQYGYRRLAQEYGVKNTTIRNIVLNHGWKNDDPNTDGPT